MADTYTNRAAMIQMALNDPNWNVTLNNLIAQLDGFNSIGALATAPRENPSSSLYVSIASGQFINQANNHITYAGTGSNPLGLPASSTTYIWLTDGNVLTTGTSFPAQGSTKYLPLAIVTTGTTSIATIVDARCGVTTAG